MAAVGTFPRESLEESNEESSSRTGRQERGDRGDVHDVHITHPLSKYGSLCGIFPLGRNVSVGGPADCNGIKVD